MAEFMMFMKGESETGDWDTYIGRLVESGTFRGGSALGNGIAATRDNAALPCTVTGFMRFEADDISQVTALLPGNPVYDAGGEIEIQELIPD